MSHGKRKIVFIVPPSGYKAAPGWDYVAKMPLEGVSVAATVAGSAGYNVECRDLREESLRPDMLLDELRREHVRIICLAGTPDGYPFIKDFTAKAKRKLEQETRVIVGGPLATLSWKILLKRTEVDYCIRGECEYALPELLRRLVKGGKPNLDGLPIASKDNLSQRPRVGAVDINYVPCPNYNDLWKRSFGQHLPEMISYSTQRGCPYKCRFCANPLRATRLRLASKEKISKDLESLRSQGFKRVWLNDPTFNTNISHCRCVMEAMRNFNMQWACTLRPHKNLVTNKRLFSDMRAAGCERVFLGIESGSKEIVETWKGTPLSIVKECLKAARKADMPVEGFLILGLPGETFRTLRATRRMCIHWHFVPRAHFAVPFPGSALYATHLREMRKRYRKQVRRSLSEMDIFCMEEEILERIAALRYDGSDEPFLVSHVPQQTLQPTMYWMVVRAAEMEEKYRLSSMKGRQHHAM